MSTNHFRETSAFFFFTSMLIMHMGFPGGSVVKNSPTKQETQVQSLGWEDSLENEMTTYSGILA